MLELLLRPADQERRAALWVLASMRWVLVAVAAFQINFRPGSSSGELTGLNVLLLLAALMNVALQWLLATNRPIFLAMPIALAAYDVAGITGAIAVVGQFDNPSFLLYYPALMSVVLVFPGKWSAIYTCAMLGGYVVAACVRGDSFDIHGTGDQKDLIIRTVTLVTVAFTANLVIRVEWRRRVETSAGLVLKAVEAERERARELILMEQRAIEAERRAQAERHRLSQEVHDGVSQNIYMLTLGLETAGEAVKREPVTAPLAERMEALVRLSRQALMETRHLLYDLDRVMTGEASFASLVQHQAREFQAVSGIATEVRVEGSERPLDATLVGELFRVVQEALSNVMRHAGASSVLLTLAYEPNQLVLTLTDDGHGFETGLVGGGHGLANMRNRLERLGGELVVESAPEAGTTVQLRVTYDTSRAEDPRPAGG